jgi:hypothetical protein
MPYKDPEMARANGIKYREANKAKLAAGKKVWHEANGEAVAVKAHLGYEANKAQRQDRIRAYKETHLEQIAAYQKLYKRERRRTDPAFKLADQLRHRLYLALKNNAKKGSAIGLLGCSVEEARQHLESRFRLGMTWQNHGCWHIDHIRPLASFDLQNPTQLAQACHYTNMQPLWAWENLKKSDKYQHSD